MIELLLALLAGMLTIGAPCILPMLPILLGASVGQTSKSRPIFIVLGFILTFGVLGLFLSILTNLFHFEPSTLRTAAVVLLALFGLFMLWPRPFERLTVRMNSLINRANQVGQAAGQGNLGGFVLGLTLGIVWTPCAGPVLGAILTLVATQTDLSRAGILLFAYAVGAGIPMLLIAFGSQYLTTKIKLIAHYSRLIQRIFGIIIILVALSIYFQYDTVIQAKLLAAFPAWNFANSSIFK